MTAREKLRDLFAGPHPGHAVVITPPFAPAPAPGDFLFSDAPATAWRDCFLRRYEAAVAWHEAIGDDGVPFVSLSTGTELFAAAFGSNVKVYPRDPPAARPLVTTASEADALAQPSCDTGLLARVFAMADALAERLGPDAILGVPDIQSPFDIAALIWNKQDLLLACYDSPAAVERLTARCRELLESFLDTFLDRYPRANLCHCPYAWAPPELGAWLSEDEAGALSAPMFERFCLPPLTTLSERYGGLFLHCCATADHQYPSFRKIPRLRGLNRVFQEPHPGPQPAIDAFAGETVLIVAWITEDRAADLLRRSHADSRWLFNLTAPDVDSAKALCERMRKTGDNNHFSAPRTISSTRKAAS